MMDDLEALSRSAARDASDAGERDGASSAKNYRIVTLNANGIIGFVGRSKPSKRLYQRA